MINQNPNSEWFGPSEDTMEGWALARQEMGWTAFFAEARKSNPEFDEENGWVPF